MDMRSAKKRAALTAAVFLMWGCDQGNPTTSTTTTTSSDDSDATSAPPELGFKKSAVLVTPEGNQTCTGPTDPTCSAKGPTQQLSCSMGLECELWTTDTNCTYPEGAGLGAPMACSYASCSNDADCGIKSPDSNLDFECIYTDQSVYGDEIGVCLFTWPLCSTGNGPCMVDGYMMCATENDDSDCSCSASEDLSEATEETCDGIDNDCDGFVDEDLTTPTTCGVGACASTGQIACVDGEWVSDTCMPGDPSPSETCDGIDNDCDGSVDEETDVLLECGVGACWTSVWNHCVLGSMETNVCTPNLPSAEMCDDIDNDCDGELNNGNPGGGESCDTGLPGACAVGTTNCTDGALVCDQNVMISEEVCDNVDNDCDGWTDEGCDDDADGYCDSMMDLGPGALCGSGGDCDDENPNVNPGMQELCSTVFDDNCDGDTVHLADLTTPACSSCANAIKIPCGVPTSVSMSSPNGTNAIQSYQCWSPLGAKLLSTDFAASEAVIEPDAPDGTPFSLQITTPGTGTVAFRLHESCEPNPGSEHAVTAYHTPGLNGTCAAYSSTSVANGMVGQDFIALDATSNQVVTVLFTCTMP